ncbi:patched domain-containing protein 3-like [Centruroides vittatus]|uniref:patched domain-containing protein 3-like n=1 Tax=Centruroides vittatus TaxID=120091 RepID=UPI00350F1D5F
MSKNHLQNFLISKYESLGRIIGKYPIYFLLLPLLFSIVMASFIYKMEFSRNPFYLFSPINGQWSKDKEVITRLFPMDVDDYDPSRAIDDDNFILFQIIAKDGLSILRENVFKEIVQFNKIITNWNVNYESKNWTYKQLCAKYNNQCPLNFGLLLDKKIEKFREGKFKVVYPIEIDLKRFKVIPWFYNLGGVTTDESGHLLDALAFRLVYTLSVEDEKQVICKEWESTLQQHLKDTVFQEIIIEPVGLSTFETEMKIFISSSLPLIIYSLLCTVLFAVVSCMTNDWVRSKPWLGVSSCISALMSVASTFGFLTISKVESADITIVLPFLILGMGIDDSFVLISAWRRSNVKKSVEERMGESYSEAAVSITITSLTSCLSFCIGIITNLPIVRIFSIFASVAIFFTYIYQITFFGACMALSGYREEKRIHSLLCCKRLQNEKERSDSHTGKDSILKFFEDKIGELLMKTWMKTFIIISYFFGVTFINLGTESIKRGSFG